MSNKLIYIRNILLLIFSTLLMTGCGVTQKNITKQPITTSENISSNMQKETENKSQKVNLSTANNENLLSSTNVNLKYSKAIENFYTQYKEILRAYFPQYTLSKISVDTLNDSKFYSFNVNTKEGYTQPEVTFHNDRRSFYITLPNKISNKTLQNIIMCTVMAADNSINLKSANDIMQNLSNSFDGSNNSSVISTDNYKFYISDASEVYLGRLNVVSVLEINPSINKSNYSQATNDLFNGKLNKGTNVYFKGSISENYNLGTHWCLEVKNGSDTYCVYYNYNNFIDCFEIGNTYTFYGEIAALKNGYAGCLRLDYITSEE